MPRIESIVIHAGPQGITGATGATGNPGPALTPNGTQATVGALPASGNTVGDLWLVTGTNHAYGWNGTAWVDLGPFAAQAWGSITGTLSAQTDLNTALGNVTPGDGQIIIGATTPIKTNGPINVKAKGAVGNGTTSDTTAFTTAMSSAAGTRRIDVPEATYGVGSSVVLRSGPVHIRGDGTTSTVIKPTTAFSNLLLGSTSFPIDHVILEDLTIDGAGLAFTNAINTAASIQRLTVRRCRFINMEGGTGISLQSIPRATVQDCDFLTNGKASGNGITVTQGTYDLDVLGCSFEWLNNGIQITGNTSTDNQQMIRRVNIDNCRFDGYWWLLNKSSFTNSGGTVTYTSTGLTDTAAAFTGISVPYKVTVRALPVKVSGNLSASGTQTTLSGTGFSTNSVYRGDLIRTNDGTKWAVVDSVVSDTLLNIECWRDSTTFQPVFFTASTTACTIYGVVTGSLSSFTATTLTNLLPWTDRAGNQTTPAAGTLYEVLIPHGTYNLQANAVGSDIRVTNSTFRRGWADQCSLYCARAQVLGNVIEGGQDEGITHNGGIGTAYGHSVIADNRIRDQGTSGIYNTAPHTIIHHNAIDGWGIVNPNVKFAIDNNGSNTIVQGNDLNGESRPAAQYGIKQGVSDGASLLDNKIVNLTAGGSDIWVYPNSGPVYVTNLHVRGKHTFNHTANSVTNPGGFYELRGTGSPASVVVAGVGSEWKRTDGGTSTTLYIKESGTDASGWTAK